MYSIEQDHWNVSSDRILEHKILPALAPETSFYVLQQPFPLCRTHLPHMRCQACSRHRPVGTWLTREVRSSESIVMNSFNVSSKLFQVPCGVAALLATIIIFFQMGVSDVDIQMRAVTKCFWAQAAGEFFVAVWIVMCTEVTLQPGTELSTVLTTGKCAWKGTPSGRIRIVSLQVRIQMGLRICEKLTARKWTCDRTLLVQSSNVFSKISAPMGLVFAELTLKTFFFHVLSDMLS